MFYVAILWGYCLSILCCTPLQWPINQTDRSLSVFIALHTLYTSSAFSNDEYCDLDSVWRAKGSLQSSVPKCMPWKSYNNYVTIWEIQHDQISTVYYWMHCFQMHKKCHYKYDVYTDVTYSTPGCCKYGSTLMFEEGFHLSARPQPSVISDDHKYKALYVQFNLRTFWKKLNKTLHHLPVSWVGDVSLADLLAGSASPFLPAVSVHHPVQQWQEKLTQVARPPRQDIVCFQSGLHCIRSLTFPLNTRPDLLICAVIQYDDLSLSQSHRQSACDQNVSAA